MACFLCKVYRYFPWYFHWWRWLGKAHNSFLVPRRSPLGVRGCPWVCNGRLEGGSELKCQAAVGMGPGGAAAVAGLRRAEAACRDGGGTGALPAAAAARKPPGLIKCGQGSPGSALPLGAKCTAAKRSPQTRSSPLPSRDKK